MRNNNINIKKMKTKLYFRIILTMFFVVTNLCQLTARDTMAVCEKDYPVYNMRDFDIKELAELLVKEKRVGEPNDSAFADFFRRCGLEYGELPKCDSYLEYKYHVREGYYKIYIDKSFIKAISVYYKSEDGKLHHTIAIAFPKDDIDRLQWMTVQLRVFGMKDVKSDAIKLEGYNLRGLGMRGFFEISY